MPFQSIQARESSAASAFLQRAGKIDSDGLSGLRRFGNRHFVGFGIWAPCIRQTPRGVPMKIVEDRSESGSIDCASLTKSEIGIKPRLGGST